MINHFTRYMAVITVCTLLFLSSCVKDTIADPTGTQTTNINYTVDATPIHLYQGLADDGPYTVCANCAPPRIWSYIVVDFGMNNSINFVFNTAEEEAMNSNSYSRVDLGNINGEVADMGAMKGLGYVAEKPVSGWSNSCAVTPGHGYVLRIKKSKNYSDASLAYTYGRVYVDRYVLNNTNGIIGASLKVQYPF